MTIWPQFGFQILSAIQRSWPRTTKAASSARLAIAVFCALDQPMVIPHAAQFFEFLSFALRSLDSALVMAVLELFDRPDDLNLVRANAVDAILKLCPSLLGINSEHWYPKLKRRRCSNTFRGWIGRPISIGVSRLSR
jgi:hypothetical protein